MYDPNVRIVALLLLVARQLSAQSAQDTLLNALPARIGAFQGAVSLYAKNLDTGETVAAALVVMGVGVRPRTALAEAAGLRVEDGVVVDALM